jgi:hypothetical protein
MPGCAAIVPEIVRDPANRGRAASGEPISTDGLLHALVSYRFKTSQTEKCFCPVKNVPKQARAERDDIEQSPSSPVAASPHLPTAPRRFSDR